MIGVDLYEAFIKGYTKKQWGIDPKLFTSSTLTRLPVRSSFFDSYFDDYYQGLPVKGYTNLFTNMLKGVPVELNTDFFDDREYWLKSCNTLIFTGQIDRYFEYSLGHLQWRSVRFEQEEVDVEDFQGTSVMNFADEEIPYTRIHEPRHLHRERVFKKNTSVVIREYSCIDHDEAYYPVNSETDKQLFYALRKYG